MKFRLYISILLICGSMLFGCAKHSGPASIATPSSDGDGQAAEVAEATVTPPAAPGAPMMRDAIGGRRTSTPGSQAGLDALRIDGQAYIFSLRTASCESNTPTVCNDGELAISNLSGRLIDTLKLPTVVVDRNHLLFEGTLAGTTFVNEGQTLIFSDIDSDKMADLAIHTGNDAGYGGGSYSVYLFDPHARKFVFSDDLSRLTEDPYLGMFRIVDGKINVGAKSGCCDSQDELYRVIDGKPSLVKQVIHNTSAATGITTITTRTLFGREWVVQTSSK